MSQCFSISTRDIIVLAIIYIVAGAISAFFKGMFAAMFRERHQA